MGLRVLEVPAGTRKMYEALMVKVLASGRVALEQEGEMTRWGEQLLEVLARMGEEYHRTFLKELERQVMRQGDKPYDVEDVILRNTLAAMVLRADELMVRQSHPSLELMCRRVKNRIYPYGSVLYRGTRFVARRNSASITVQMTARTIGGELEEMLDTLDALIEEEA